MDHELYYDYQHRMEKGDPEIDPGYYYFSDINKVLIYTFNYSKAEKEEYFAIREKIYRERLGLKNFKGDEDYHDIGADFLIIKDGKKVVGGARIVYSPASNRIDLPFEEEGYYLKDLFPNLSLDMIDYCEGSRIALLKEYRGVDRMKKIGIHINERARRKGMEIIFSVSPFAQQRYYRRLLAYWEYRYYVCENSVAPKRAVYSNLTNCIALCQLQRREYHFSQS